jgi:hypothetical protein
LTGTEKIYAETADGRGRLTLSRRGQHGCRSTVTAKVGAALRAVAMFVSAASFGLAHAAGGWQYVLLAAVAGCGYALVYHRTTRLEMAILCHFTVNAVHFLLFTYPALA